MNELLNILSKNIFLALSVELDRQNHKLTGALVNSFEHKIEETAEKTIVNFFMNNYGVFLNDGIPPERIPYTPTPPVRGGTSKYIQGLIRWVKLKFRYSEKKAVGVAFAIARKHKKKGYPLTQRGFINITLAANADEINSFIQDWTEVLIEDALKSFLQTTNI